MNYSQACVILTWGNCRIYLYLRPFIMAENKQDLFAYTEESIRSLDWKEHIRLRPGMYIGKLGDGSSADDGIYVLVKEVVDNCIDEYTMGHGKQIEVKIEEKTGQYPGLWQGHSTG